MPRTVSLSQLNRMVSHLTVHDSITTRMFVTEAASRACKISLYQNVEGQESLPHWRVFILKT